MVPRAPPASDWLRGARRRRPMAVLGEVAARWAPGLWRRAVRAAAWLGGRRFASGGTQVRAADTGWAAGARGTSRAGLGAGFPTSGCHFHSPALAASGDVTSPAGLPRGSLSPRLRPHSPPSRGPPGGWGLGTLGRTPAPQVLTFSTFLVARVGGGRSDAAPFGVSPARATHSPCDLRQVTAAPWCSQGTPKPSGA